MIEVYEGDADILLNSKWWAGKSDLEIVETQLYVKGLVLICDYQVFLTALGHVFGRRFTENELGKQEPLIEEFEQNIRLHTHDKFSKTMKAESLEKRRPLRALSVAFSAANNNSLKKYKCMQSSLFFTANAIHKIR